MNVSLVGRNNFSIDDFSPESISVLDPSTFELHLKPALVNGKKSTLTITGLSDRAGNFMMSSQHNLMFFEAHPVSRKDIIITEIQADPAPVVGLPETEYLEIYNRSANPVQLDRWIIADESNEARLPKRILLPQEYLVLTVSSKAFQFQHALGVNSFPGLTNAGEPLILKDSTGRTVDSVHYTVEWHDHSEKADGGWALELIDPENICSEGENWTSSTDEAGGTPGRENSVKAEKPDLTPPVVTAVFALSADTLTVAFNEKLNEQLPSRENFAISPPLTMGSVFFADKSKRAYTIALSTPIQNRTRYQITFDNIADCAGNAYRPESELYFALPEKAEPGDIIVNEILFNPRPTGVDFVELFNRSEKYINLKDWNSANLVNDTLTNKKEITNDNIIFAPGDFLVLTTDPNTLKGEYLQGDEQKMSKTSLPSLSDDEGSFVLLDDDQMVIDTLFYSDDQHSPFLKNDEGVSLERIDVHSSSAGNNWQSASASSGYATPGLPNSNAFQNLFEDAVSVNPEIFSPQNGQPDFAMISYNVEHAGFVANVKIVNQQGRVIKEIAENELLGVDGFFTWRGDTAQGGRAASGAYMVWFEMVDANGNVVTIKKRVVVAERF
ncbi:MAG TPA: lamin tail domain-containing protein, partial [Chryseosolibacter sp.]